MHNLIPAYILEKHHEGKPYGTLKAATMFIDISGFTAMTQELMKNGKEGAEVLTNVINNIFTPAIGAVYRRNGFISTFAGDAFTSIFTSSPTDALAAAVMIKDIFKKLGLQDTRFGAFRLKVKIGLSQGRIDWEIIENDRQNCYFFRGAGIDGCAASERNAGTGDIIFDDAILSDLSEREIIEYESRSEQHYLLKSLKLTPTRRKPKKTAFYDPYRFIPKVVLDTKSPGEFRDIVSCFISFVETSHFQNGISRVITLTHDFGGYFNKIDFGDKGGVMLVLFGAPISYEKLYIRALDFALSVIKITDLTCRIGLTSGTSFTGFVGSDLRSEYTALGAVVNMSARLMMSASWDEIYLDQNIREYISEEYMVKYKEKQLFKGFEKKLPVYRLIAHSERAVKISFKDEMIGRSKELESLIACLQPVNEGKFGGIVLIDGNAGIGKSRLVSELKSTLEETDYKWFYLPCDEILRKSFNPLIHFLHSYFNQSENNTPHINKANFERELNGLIKSTSDEDIRKELIRTKSILGSLLNLYWKNSLYDALDAKGRHDNTLYALKNLIKAECLQKPVIIELDDGPWVDPETREWLAVLTRNVAEYPFLIISECRYNDDGTEFDFGLKDVLLQRIVLNNLSEEGSLALTLTLLKTETIPDETFDLIFTKSDGNQK